MRTVYKVALLLAFLAAFAIPYLGARAEGSGSQVLLAAAPQGGTPAGPGETGVSPQQPAPTGEEQGLGPDYEDEGDLEEMEEPDDEDEGWPTPGGTTTPQTVPGTTGGQK